MKRASVIHVSDLLGLRLKREERERERDGRRKERQSMVDEKRECWAL